MPSQINKKPKSENSKDSFFIAVNGYSGFRSHYSALFASPAYKRLYIIEGGPGTGKRRSMSEIAAAAEARGGSVRYIYCSSDPDSLDGIILENGDRRVAVLDGTAPHTRPPAFPGAIDEVINLGDFWDSERLRARREEIVRLTEKKQDAYRHAYAHLSLAGKIDELLNAQLSECLDHEKLKKAAHRVALTLRESNAPGEQLRYYRACSMKGQVTLPPPAGASLINVTDYLGSGHFFLDALREELRQNGKYNYHLIPSCYTDKKTNGIYLPQDNLMFFNGESSGAKKTINMHRFILAEEIKRARPALRRLIAMHEETIERALAHLRTAGAHHFALEEIYGSAMNFPQKEAFVQGLVARILAVLFPAADAAT